MQVGSCQVSEAKSGRTPTCVNGNRRALLTTSLRKKRLPTRISEPITSERTTFSVTKESSDGVSLASVYESGGVTTIGTGASVSGQCLLQMIG